VSLSRVALLLWLGALAATAAQPLAPTAVGRTARQVAAEVGASGAASPLAVAISAPTPELARGFFAALVPELARLQHSALWLEAPRVEAERAARAAGARSLLRVTLSAERGLLTARGDLFRVQPNFWSGAAGTRSGPGAAIATSTEVDAHALALAAPLLDPRAGPPTALTLAAAPLALLPAQTAALAAADLDSDGRDELLVLTGTELRVLGPTGALLARRSLREVPATGLPCREPFGSLTVVPGSPARIGYFSAQRGRGEWVELSGRELRPVGPLEQPLLLAGSTRVEGVWTAGQNTFRLPQLPEPVVHAALFVGASGAQVLAVQPDGNGSWWWLGREQPPVALSALGTATTLVDLDGDGSAEIATTSSDFAPQPERVRVTDAGQAVLWEVELERGRILQLVSADLDGDHRPELVAAVWLPDGTAELRVLRGAGP